MAESWFALWGVSDNMLLKTRSVKIRKAGTLRRFASLSLQALSVRSSSSLGGAAGNVSFGFAFRSCSGGFARAPLAPDFVFRLLVRGIASLGPHSKNAAIYFPRIVRSNPLHENMLEVFAPSGAVAGVFARTDAARGVWKVPPGPLLGVPCPKK